TTDQTFFVCCLIRIDPRLSVSSAFHGYLFLAFFPPISSHGRTPTRFAHASHAAASSLTLAGSWPERSCSSVRSASMSYSSHGWLYFITSFHFPCRTARLPSCSQKIGFGRSSGLPANAGRRLTPSGFGAPSLGFAPPTSRHVAI